MPEVVNDGLPLSQRVATSSRDSSEDRDWPRTHRGSGRRPSSSQDDCDSPRTDAAPSTKPGTDDDDAPMIGMSDSPAPSGMEIEAKDKDALDSGVTAVGPSSTQQRSDGWMSGFAIPGVLPPPKRLEFTSSFLRPGSRFSGKQQSDKQVYNVEVTFKSVDIANSFLCGYLRIEGLTKDHPTLTTYFEGEIIGTKYTFQTRHEKWGATEKTDMQHWNRFPAWRPLATQAKRPDFHYKNYMEKENVFMRWKEYFLVPDHHVREIQGASFEGFYYICFNQVKGSVSGIYFHAKSEKFQQLELEHVDDLSGFAAVEFR